MLFELINIMLFLTDWLTFISKFYVVEHEHELTNKYTIFQHLFVK